MPKIRGQATLGQGRQGKTGQGKGRAGVLVEGRAAAGRGYQCKATGIPTYYRAYGDGNPLLSSDSGI